MGPGNHVVDAVQIFLWEGALLKGDMSAYANTPTAGECACPANTL